MGRTTADSIVRSARTYLAYTQPGLVAFWRRGEENVKEFDLLAHADYIYSAWLLGEEGGLSGKAADRFAQALSKASLSGNRPSGKQALPHLTAYALGANNILAAAGHDRRPQIYESFDLALSRLVNVETRLPKWPVAWSHHIWRVSHWIGGVPSILLNFARFDPKGRVTETFVHEVLQACDAHILNEHTGLMKTYRSPALQSCFRTLYKMRHEPDLADIGGLAHVHWMNHALGRQYKAGRHLLDITTTHMDQHFPFLEGSPYCLDFDYVQLQRTALEQHPEHDPSRIYRRATLLQVDLMLYLSAIPESYKLHKLPGALAALHEATMILKSDVVPGINIAPRDIIRTALWL